MSAIITNASYLLSSQNSKDGNGSLSRKHSSCDSEQVETAGWKHKYVLTKPTELVTECVRMSIVLLL